MTAWREGCTGRGAAFSELYRENGEWRFRAIGQGYASGLYGVVTAHGVVLD